MKIAITADLHLNCNPYGKIMENGLPLKVYDNFKALDFFVDSCIEKGVCIAFFVGDVFDSPAPSSKVRRLLNKRIQKLISNNIEVVMLVGNHDSYMEHHALEPLIGWTKRLKIIEDTGVEGYGDSNICFVYIPHTRKIENKEITFKEYVSKLKSNMPKLKDKRVILFGHFGVFGALRNDYNTNKASEDVSVIDLEALNCEICFLGDYHKRQKISKTQEIWYVGSMERQDFSEMNQEKGFCIYDIDTKEIEWVNYAARKMTVLECNGLPEVLSSVQTSDLKDSVVKIKITGLQEFFDVQQRFNEIASMVREKEAMFFAGLEKPKPEEHKDSLPIETIDSDSIDVYQIVESEIKEVSKRDSESEEEIIKRINFLTQIKKDVQIKTQLSSRATSSGKKLIRFKWIKYHNFCRFGEKDNVLNLDDLFKDQNDDMSGIASVMGSIDFNEEEANGAGKSALFEGIAYALYEKMPRLSSVRNRDKRTTFEMIRTDDSGNYACREAFVELCIDVDGEEWIIKRGRKLSGKDTHTAILDIKKDGSAFNSRTNKEPNRIIIDLMGMDFEPFCNSVFFAQKDTSKIFTLTPKGRIDTILNVLGVLRDVDDVLEVIREDKKKKNKDEITQLEAKISVYRNAAQQDDSQINKVIKEAKILEKSLEEEVKKLEETIATLNEVKTSLNVQKEIERQKKLSAEREISEADVKKEETKKPMRLEKKALEDKIKEEKRKISSYNDELSSIQRDYTNQTSIAKSINVDALKKELEQIEKAKLKIESVEEDIVSIQKSRYEILALKSNKQGSIEPLDTNLKKYETVLSSSSGELIECPYCHSEKPRAELVAQKTKIEDEIKEVERIITEYSVKELDASKRLSVATDALKSLRDLVAKEVPCLSKISKFENAELGISKLKQRAKTLKENHAKSIGEPISELESKITAVEKAIIAVDKSFEENVKTQKKAVELIDDGITKISFSLKKNEDDISKTVYLISSKRKERERVLLEIRSNEDLLKNLTRCRNELVSLQSQLDEAYKLQKRIILLETLFGSEGVRTRIVDIYLPIFNRHLADFLTILTSGRLNVQLEQKTMEPKITGGSSSIYEMLSGGEQDVIRLAANLALGMVSLGSSRSLPETLFLDEIFGSFAPAMQTRVFDLLKYLRAYFKRILVITHNPDLQDKFSRIVLVQKNGGISSIGITGV